MNLILPIILIAISFSGFFYFTKPSYDEMGVLKQQEASYNSALDNARTLESERDKLTKKYNSIDPENLTKLSKLLPDNVDNIRLILEIEKVAAPYGMALRDVKYDAENTDKTAVDVNGIPPESRQDYGTWNLEFSTKGTYNNFLNFVRDLEKNLRIVDIASVEFSSATGLGTSPALSSIYTYNFKIKTYWLKN